MIFIKIVLFLIFIWFFPITTILFTIGNFVSQTYSETYLLYSFWIWMLIDCTLIWIAHEIQNKNKKLFFIKKYNIFAWRELDYRVFSPYFITFLVYFDYKKYPKKYSEYLSDRAS